MPERSEDLQQMSVDELQRKAKEAGIHGYSDMRKDELIKALEGQGRGHQSRRSER